MRTSTNKNMYKMIKIAFTVMVVLIIVYVTMSISMTAYDLGYRIFTETAIDEAPGKDVEVIIEDDMSAKEIGEELYKCGLVRDANLFYLQYKLSAYSGEIVSGVYTLNTSMEPEEMMEIMADTPDDDESTGE